MNQAGKLQGWVLIFLLYALIATPAQASFGQFSIRDELELARKFDLIIETRFPVVHDSHVTGYVQSLVDRLVAVMPPQPFPIKVTVVRNGAMNAFASAGGHITIFTGLLANLDGEDELASVIAHELAHVSERHIASSIEKSQLVGVGSLLGILAGVLVGSQGGGDGAGAMVLGSVAGARALQLKYTRDNEKDADQYGLDFLVGAGFSPMGMTAAFDKIRKLQWLGGGGDAPSYLSTHPGMDDRLAYMQERIARLPADVRARRSNNASYDRAKLMVRAWYSDPNTARALFAAGPGPTTCLDRLGAAIAASRLRQVDEAARLFAEALACNGSDPLWKREFGRFAFEFGSLPQALSALQEAVLRDPRDLFALFFYARALAEQGNYTQSVAAMERIIKEVPRDAEVLDHLARYQAALGRHFSAHVNYAKAFAYRRQFRKYEFHMQKAEVLAQTVAEKETITKVVAEISEYREILEI